jgi:hypothetical protein
MISYDRFGVFYNECCKALGEALRFYGVQGQDAKAAASVVSESIRGVSRL